MGDDEVGLEFLQERKDLVIEVEGKNLKVTCNDGKTRNIKL